MKATNQSTLTRSPILHQPAPSAQQVYKALCRLAVARAEGMVERAAMQTGGWTPQLTEVARLIRRRGQGGHEL